VSINRRRFITDGAAATVAAALGTSTSLAEKAHAAAGDPSASERGQMADAVNTFMKTYDVPGLGIAIVRQGRLVYDEAFGFADMAARTPLAPTHRFRIASISKPITSVAVFKLIEDGRLTLGDRVFGSSGILHNDYGPVPTGSRIGDITVEHLLTHTSGGWPNDGTDPMFRQPELDHAALIATTLKKQALANPPGAVFAYSNFGYCLLGRVIEKVTQRSYAAFVNEAILSRAGAADMDIAGNTLAERQPLEVRYYGHGKDDPYAVNVRRMDSHGGWLARPAAIALFASSVDGFSRPSILKRDTIDTMTTPSTPNAKYAKGWRVNRSNNWWHTGHLPGASGIMVRTHSRFCWAALLNTRHRDDGLDRDLDRLIWTMVRKVPHWRA
jgi:CubicO group peptidase (beta-lactamase class C family)